jgi:hypothetical protein
MLVNFFIVRKTSNSSSIDTMYERFGNTTPKYLELEGGESAKYLFCVNSDDSSIIDMCNQYKYELIGRTFDETRKIWQNLCFILTDVPKNAYNPNYQVSVSSSSSGKITYSLVKK